MKKEDLVPTERLLSSSTEFCHRLTLEICLLAEVLALPIDGLVSFVGPQCTDEVLKARFSSVKWLLDDSKIAPRTKDSKLADNLCVLMTHIVALEKQIKDLNLEWRNQSQKQIGGSEFLRTQLLRGKSEQLLASWENLINWITMTIRPLVDQRLQEKAGIEPVEIPLDAPQEAREYHDKYLSEKPCFAGFGRSECPEGSSPFERVTNGVDVIHAAAQTCLYCQRVELWNTNCQKIQNKKKNVNWSMKFGRGLEEYASHGPTQGKDVDYAQILIPRNQSSRKPKTPKGCLDFNPSQMKLRDTIFDKIRSIFSLYGAEAIDTPVFELKEVLTGKYGEDQKLIYDLKDQGGEQLGLRYDLTVPFARFCASNNVEKIRRYHIGKVYRRDEPQVARGRLREFYQCDVDIAGAYDCMTAEGELLTMLIHLLRTLRPIVGSFKIKLSHRAFLDGMMSLAGVPQAKLRAISSAIDKLDKEEWDVVEKEMCEEKGLAAEVAQRIKTFVTITGSYETVKAKLTSLPGVTSNSDLQRAFHELDILFKFLEFIPDLHDLVCFDTSLARGLDYYTGLIYEAVLSDGDGTTLGSIAAGGRYDGLIGLFGTKPIPAAGVSLGVERVFRLIESNFVVDKYKIANKKDPSQFAYTNKSDVFVLGVGEDMIKEKLKIATMLRLAGLRVEFGLQEKLKLAKQIPLILESRIPIGVIIGENELATGRMKVKEFVEDGTGEEREVPVIELVSTIRDMLAKRRDGSKKLDELLFACEL